MSTDYQSTLTSQINDRGRLLIFEEKGPEVGLIEERSFIVFAENFPWGRLLTRGRLLTNPYLVEKSSFQWNF